MRRMLPPTLALILLMITIPLGLLTPVFELIPWPWRIGGLFPLIGGLALARSSHALFERVGANIETFGTPSALVISGPFAFTRNPMYLGLAAFLAGVAAVIGSLTAWIAPIAFIAVAARYYIPFEEGRMQATFGAQYDEYQARVPRWLGRVTRTRRLVP